MMEGTVIGRSSRNYLPSQVAPAATKKWKLYPLLSFLNDSTHERPTSGNMGNREDLTEDPSEQYVLLDLHTVPDEDLQESLASCHVVESPTASSFVT